MGSTQLVKLGRISVASGMLLLVVVGCYWLFVVLPILTIALIVIVVMICYFHGPEIIDLTLGNTKRQD